MKRSLKIIAAVLVVYVLVLVLLTAAEAQAADASIDGFWDAVWFSLITMTTVGYGDMSPVTVVGRVLAIILAFCSMGLLSAFVGFGLQAVNGEMLPRLRLKRERASIWYVFAEENPDSAVLARQLSEEGLVILPPTEKDARLVSGNVLRTGLSLEELVKLRRSPEGITAFFMGPDSWENYSAALAAADTGVELRCMSDITADRLPDNLKLFRPSDCLARFYWAEHPLQSGEKRLVLIGSGKTAESLLERALLTNVFAEERELEYELFGDWTDFRALHPGIVQALSSGTEGDRVNFHEENWQDARSLLERADRIVFCAEEDGENLENFRRISGFFTTGAAVHVRLRQKAPGVLSFGEREEILSPELVIRSRINALAVEMNEIYNRESPEYARSWQELPEFFRQSNITAADHMVVKLRWLLQDESIREISPELCQKAYARYKAEYESLYLQAEELEHRRWMRFYQMYNWSYDPVRNDALRHHPMMIPFGELSEKEQRKDDYAWELIGKLQ